MEKVTNSDQILGQKISKIWCGYAAVFFLELGELSSLVKQSVKGEYSSEKGEFTIMIEGDWLLKKGDEVLLQRFSSSYEDIESITADLIGTEVKSITIDEANKSVDLGVGSNYSLLVKEHSGHQLTILPNIVLKADDSTLNFLQSVS